MIKNKDGSYNIFRIFIISLIFIIGISITGIYINENIELPKIEVPKLPILTPTSTPTLIPTQSFQTSNEQVPTVVDSNWSVQFNESQNPTSWNWSYKEGSYNTSYATYSNWTYPSNINSTMYLLVVGGGWGSGQYINLSNTMYVAGGGHPAQIKGINATYSEIGGSGGTGAYGYYNVTYFVGAGGPGTMRVNNTGDIDGAGIYHAPIEPTITPSQTPTLETNMTLILSPFFQDPSANLLWVILPIITIVFMALIMGIRTMFLIPLSIMISLSGILIFHNWLIAFTAIFVCVFITSFDWFREEML